MAQPADYAVTITVNDVDVTSFVPYESMSFEDHAHTVSSFRFTIENPTGITPARANSVIVVAKNLSGAPTIFNGLIIELETTKRDNGIAVEYGVEAADQKIRLQKSIVGYNNFAGTDAAILAALLAAAYPDLSSIFDFATDVTSFMSDLELPANDDSLLDLIGDLADLTGAAYRFEDPVVLDADTVDFDAGYSSYTASGQGLSSVAETTGGNPNNAFRNTGDSLGTGSSIRLEITFPSDVTIEDITADFLQDELGLTYVSNRWSILIIDSLSATLLNANIDTAMTHDGTWNNFRASTGSEAAWAGPYTADYIFITFELVTTEAGGAIDTRMDNVSVEHNAGGTKALLEWDQTPDAADFNIDVGAGDEFAFDLDLTEGDFDDFNSVTVIGGYTDVAIDWTYESDGDMDHFDLELPVKNIVVYKNTNTDASPTWTLQTDGIWGTDELSAKNVLYDPDNHWLYFAINPSNLSKSIRVTGTIQKPLRVRVEDVGAGDPTFAKSIYNDSITNEADAVALGQSELEKSNSIKRMDFKTYEPGLKPGQSIVFTDSARGLSETLTIQRISTQWLGSSGNAQFQIECGNEVFAGADSLIADNDKRSRQKALGAAITTSTVNMLTDDSGEPLMDDSNELLYEAV